MQDDLRFAKEMAEKQREQVRIQEEYNDAIKMSSSLTRSLQSDIEDAVNTNSALGDAAKEYLNNMKASISSLSSSQDIAKQLVSIEQDKLKIQNNAFNLSQDENDELLRQLNIAERSLNIEQQRVLATEKVDAAAKKLSETMGSMFDGLNSSVKQIPLIGNALGALGDVGTNMLKEKLSNAAMKFTTDFRAGLGAGKTTMDALSGSVGGLGRSLSFLANPYVLLAAAVLAVVAAGVIGFYKLEEAAKSFRTETGLLNSQTKDLQSTFSNVLTKTSALGANLEDISTAASAYSKEFGNIEQASDSVLTSIVTLNKNFGVSVEEAVKLNKIFQNIGGLSADQSQYLIGQTTQMAEMLGLSPDQVIKDMADSSEYAYKYFSGSPEKLRNAALQAAKLGTSIEEAGKAADSLLDFQSSITNELEASAMLGVSLDFSQARYAAANGKLIEQQQAINDQVAKLGDITKLNVFEQEALSKATGMEFESLVNQQRIRERFGKLAGEELAAAQAAVEAGKDISKMSKDDLKIQTETLAKQQEMQSTFDSMGNRLSAFGNQILMFLAPIGEILFDFLDGFLSPMINSVQGIFDAFEPINEIIEDIFGKGVGVSSIFKFIGKLLAGPISIVLNFVSNSLKVIFGIVSGIYDVFKGIITGDFGLIVDGLMSIGESLLRFFGTIPIILLNTFMDMFPKLETWFSELFGKLKVMAMNILPNWAQKLLGFGESMTSVASTQPESLATSIEDGVIQDGKVITTSPEDFLIATKNPSDLISSVGGGVNISMDSVIAELRELKAAFLSNKDVYMDSTKVTSAVSKVVGKTTKNQYI
jgi:hypothetical protein